MTNALLGIAGGEFSLPPLSAVDSVSLDALPAVVGALDALKAKALKRMLDAGSSEALPQTPPEADHHLTIEQVAECLAFTEQYVYELIRQGDLPAIEVGPKRYKRVAISALREWVMSKKIDAPEYLTYSRSRGRRGSATTTEAAGDHAARVSQSRRRSTKQRSEVGARGTRRAGVGRQTDAAAGSAISEAATWQEELSNGLR